MVAGIQFLFDSLVGFLVLMLWLRFWIRGAHIPGTHPVAHFANTLTNWAVLPLHRLLRPGSRYDFSILLVAWGITWALKIVELILQEQRLSGLSLAISGLLALGALLYVIHMGLYLLMVATFSLVILSWLQPHHPFRGVLSELLNPWLTPLQRLLPTPGNIDLSPIAFILLIQLTQYFVLPGIQNSLLQLVLA